MVFLFLFLVVLWIKFKDMCMLWCTLQLSYVHNNHYLQSWMNWGQDSVTLCPLPYLFSPLQWSVWQFTQDTLLSVWGTLAIDGGCAYKIREYGSNMTPQFKTQRKVIHPKTHLLSIIQQRGLMSLSLFLSVAHTAAMDSHKTTFPWDFSHLEIAESYSNFYTI